MVPLLFICASQPRPYRYISQIYPAAVTGGPCRSLDMEADILHASVRLSGAIFPISRSAFSQPGSSGRRKGLSVKPAVQVLSPSLCFAVWFHANIFQSICKHPFKRLRIFPELPRSEALYRHISRGVPVHSSGSKHLKLIFRLPRGGR